MFGYSGMDLHTLSDCVCVCVCAHQKRCLTAYTRSVVAMAANRKRRVSFYAAEPGHPDSSLFPLVWPLHSSKDKHPAGPRLKVDKRSTETLGAWCISASRFWDFYHILWTQSELCHHISLRLAKLLLPKTTVKWLPVCLTFALQL